jgi:hypothetical protein
MTTCNAVVITALPLIGFYCDTKWTVEALHESLAQEVRAFGLKVTLVEPGAYATDFGKSSQIADALEPYAEFRKQFLTHLADVERGDPEATAEAILKLVDAENPPLRFWARHFYSAQGPRSVCGAAGDVGSVGARVECGDGRAEEIDGSVDRATDPWNSGSETRIGSIPCSGEAGDRMEAGEVPIN